MKYRNKPVVIDAIQFVGENHNEIAEFAGEACRMHTENNLTIITLDGAENASKNDFIIKGVNGEIYPCKPDIFEKTYEEVK
ncbi:MAG: hypothetical protein KAS39_01065 [Actinomycetia bacterium]|nr:hypothetical protein [Actinomycetes bacterium]